MRGHEGLSAAGSTYDDYVRVVEKAVADARGTLDDGELDAALAGTYLRNARGMLIRRRWAAGRARFDPRPRPRCTSPASPSRR